MVATFCPAFSCLLWCRLTKGGILVPVILFPLGTYARKGSWLSKDLHYKMDQKTNLEAKDPM